ncbi:MAG TPA: hypothetical protein VE136_07005 [Anaerolineales bacterium]|nr:hypothetical protein [Anaerolineales bacterium]
MRVITSRILWGLLLIVGGVIFLLENLGYITTGTLLWAVLFALGGIAFLSAFVSNRENWWALIPGMVLLAIGVLIFLDYAIPQGTGDWGGVIVLGGIGLSFLLVYFSNRANWWAIIPAGVMLTLVAVVLLETTVRGFETGGVFFIGLGLTFALLAILPGQPGQPQSQMRWAYIPAAVLLAMGLLITAALTPLINYVWPLILIVIGLFFVARAFAARR